MVDKLERLVIDEEKEHALIKITKKNNVVHKVNSDHNVLISYFNLKVEKEKEVRKEVFNFKSKTSQEKFYFETTNTTKFTDVFDTHDDVNTQTKKFLKQLNHSAHKYFKKVRVGKHRETEYEI